MKTFNLYILSKHTNVKRVHRKWNYNIFVAESKLIHGDKYDYSLIKEEHIQGNKSKVPVICKDCYDVWWVIIKHHICSKSGCPSCAGHGVPTLKSHGNLYDYSMVQREHIQKIKSKGLIFCK